MLDIFKRRNWIPDSIPELRGTYRDLHVTVRALPCLREEHGTRRKYRYPDFGSEFIEQLHKQLGRSDVLAAQLNTGAPAHALIALRALPPISVELRGKPDPRVDQFVSDIADLLIEAFQSAGLRPS